MPRTLFPGGPYEVSNGPSKWDLIIGLFEGRSMNSQKRVYFELDTAGDNNFAVIINGISREDGSGESWIIDGYTFDDGVQMPVRLYYETRRRTGVLRLKDTN